LAISIRLVLNSNWRAEEWIKKRKVEKVTTKQIETRVKRQVVLEDGLVIDDSGPQVKQKEPIEA